MNKFGEEFMGKFDLGDISIKDFFGEDMNLINEVVNKKGWFKYENCRGEIDIEYVGEVIKEELMKEMREAERDFFGDGSEDFQYEVRDDFIDIEEVCYVRVS